MRFRTWIIGSDFLLYHLSVLTYTRVHAERYVWGGWKKPLDTSSIFFKKNGSYCFILHSEQKKDPKWHCPKAGGLANPRSQDKNTTLREGKGRTHSSIDRKKEKKRGLLSVPDPHGPMPSSFSFHTSMDHAWSSRPGVSYNSSSSLDFVRSKLIYYLVQPQPMHITKI